MDIPDQCPMKALHPQEVMDILVQHWRGGRAYQQHLQSSRQNSQPSQQIDRSFLSLGNKPFRLKLSRCCSCSRQSGSAPEDPYELWSYSRCDVCWLSITHVRLASVVVLETRARRGSQSADSKI